MFGVLVDTEHAVSQPTLLNYKLPKVSVLWDDGSVVFMTREDLGLGPDDPIATGPESKSEFLRMFVK